MSTASQEREPAAPWLREPKAEHAAPAIEKMPQLTASLERFAATAAETLGRLLGGAFAGTFEATESGETFEFLRAHESQAGAVIHSAALDARMLLIMEPRAVDVLINSMFSVDPAAEANFGLAAPDERPRTELETRLLGEIAKALAGALEVAFAPVASFDLAFETLSTVVDTSLLGARDMPALATLYTVKTASGAFRLTVLLPQSFTTPLSATLGRGPSEDAAKLDPNWTRRMEQGVTQARMTLTAILDEFELTLGDLTGFTVGKVIPLSDDGEGRVRIECVERGVFVCKLGEHNNRYALEVEDIIVRPVEGPYPGSATPSHA